MTLKPPDLQLTMSAPQALQISVSAVIDLGHRHHLLNTRVTSNDNLVGLNVQPMPRLHTADAMANLMSGYVFDLVSKTLHTFEYDTPF